jgi:DNA (cytosine-5)-methyltransferase 1
MSYEQCLNSDLEPIKGGALLHILRKLKKAGYTASFELYNAANFGAPQIRERVVIVGRHGKTKMPYLVPTHSKNGEYNLPKWKTLGEALSKLPRDVVHHYIEFPERRLKYYRMLKAGQYWKDLPLDMQKEAMGKSFNLGGGKTGFYRRLAFDKPSPTLVTHPAMPATDLGHPVDDRPLSVEEYACIQEFPKDWKIYGSLVDKYKQIGNAVPIALGNAIGHLVMASIEGEKIPSYLNFNYSRYKYTNDISWAKEVQRKLDKANAPKQLALAV